MRVLVTGATGFIGGRLCQELASKGHQVLATGRKKEFPHRQSSLIDYRSCDLETNEAVASLFSNEEVEAVFHCAGLTGVWGDYSEYFQANVLLTERLLEQAQHFNVKKFIHLSSPSLYFQYRDQFDLKEEDIPDKFSNAYAETKYLSELKVLEKHSDSFHTLCLRPRGVIGAGDTSWLPRIIDLYRSNRLVIPGDGLNQLDFTSCQNLIELMGRCLELDESAFGYSYNITNGEPVKIWEFVPHALKSLGLWQEEKPLRKAPLRLVMSLARVSEFFARLLAFKKEPKLLPLKVGVAAYSMTLNIEKARSKLGYNPTQSTEEALHEFVAWWQKREG